MPSDSPSRYVLALDQGTTSSRAILFDHAGEVVSVGQREFPQVFPKSGWVEHDPEEIWFSQEQAIRQALNGVGARREQIAAIGLTNQRETTVLWNRKTGRALGNAIVWQDRRTAGVCERLKAEGKTEFIRERTGLIPDAYFSGTKIQWLLENRPGARDLAEAGDLAFGTIDTWLLWKLTGGRVHATDASNASRTMVYNIHGGHWDQELCELLGIPSSLLPEVRPSQADFGEVSTLSDLAGVPIRGVAGDQQAALFGQACTASGMAKNTYGTGCFMLLHTGGEPMTSRNQLLTTMAAQTGERREYALEGSVFIGGAVVQWLRDGLGIIRHSGEVEELAAKVPDSGGVYLVPAFAGLGAPHWDSYARGLMIGLSRGTTAAHIARAALESIAFQSAELLQAMQADSGLSLDELRVDGGASANNTLMQFQADLLGIPVVRPKVTETTALGAAYLAGLGAGFWSSAEEIAGQWQVDRTFEPQFSEDQRKTRLDRWGEAVERSKCWEGDD
jgi:glycerol kinase